MQNRPLYVPCPFAKIPSPVNLRKRLRRHFRAPPRIRWLARPKQQTAKFTQPLVVPRGRQIQIIRDPLISTRLKQLAVPKVRKLVATRNACCRFKDALYIDRFDRMIKKSLFTVYSRLANVEVPPRRTPPPKWTESEWQAHYEWLGRRANAKWPFDFKLPTGFSEPITRVKLRAMADAVSMRPWIRNYRVQLARQTELYRKRTMPDPFSAPITKVKESAKTGPVSEYFDQYSEYLKERTEKAKAERVRRLEALNPEPRPQATEHAKDGIFQSKF